MRKDNGKHGFFRPAIGLLLAFAILTFGLFSTGCSSVYIPTVKTGQCGFDRVWTPPYQDSQRKWHEGYCRWPNEPAPGG